MIYTSALIISQNFGLPEKHRNIIELSTSKQQQIIEMLRRIWGRTLVIKNLYFDNDGYIISVELHDCRGLDAIVTIRKFMRGQLSRELAGIESFSSFIEGLTISNGAIREIFPKVCFRELIEEMFPIQPSSFDASVAFG